MFSPCRGFLKSSSISTTQPTNSNSSSSSVSDDELTKIVSHNLIEANIFCAEAVGAPTAEL